MVDAEIIAPLANPQMVERMCDLSGFNSRSALSLGDCGRYWKTNVDFNWTKDLYFTVSRLPQSLQAFEHGFKTDKPCVYIQMETGDFGGENPFHKRLDVARDALLEKLRENGWRDVNPAASGPEGRWPHSYNEFARIDTEVGAPFVFEAPGGGGRLIGEKFNVVGFDSPCVALFLQADSNDRLSQIIESIGNCSAGDALRDYTQFAMIGGSTDYLRRNVLRAMEAYEAHLEFSQGRGPEPLLIVMGDSDCSAILDNYEASLASGGPKRRLMTGVRLSNGQMAQPLFEISDARTLAIAEALLRITMDDQRTALSYLETYKRVLAIRADGEAPEINKAAAEMIIEKLREGMPFLDRYVAIDQPVVDVHRRRLSNDGASDGRFK